MKRLVLCLVTSLFLASCAQPKNSELASRKAVAANPFLNVPVAGAVGGATVGEPIRSPISGGTIGSVGVTPPSGSTGSTGGTGGTAIYMPIVGFPVAGGTPPSGSTGGTVGGTPPGGTTGGTTGGTIGSGGTEMTDGCSRDFNPSELSDVDPVNGFMARRLGVRYQNTAPLLQYVTQAFTEKKLFSHFGSSFNVAKLKTYEPSIQFYDLLGNLISVVTPEREARRLGIQFYPSDAVKPMIAYVKAVVGKNSGIDAATKYECKRVYLSGRWIANSWTAVQHEFDGKTIDSVTLGTGSISRTTTYTSVVVDITLDSANRSYKFLVNGEYQVEEGKDANNKFTFEGEWKNAWANSIQSDPLSSFGLAKLLPNQGFGTVAVRAALPANSGESLAKGNLYLALGKMKNNRPNAPDFEEPAQPINTDNITELVSIQNDRFFTVSGRQANQAGIKETVVNHFEQKNQVINNLPISDYFQVPSDNGKIEVAAVTHRTGDLFNTYMDTETYRSFKGPSPYTWTLSGARLAKDDIYLDRTHTWFDSRHVRNNAFSSVGWYLTGHRVGNHELSDERPPTFRLKDYCPTRVRPMDAKIRAQVQEMKEKWVTQVQPTRIETADLFLDGCLR